MSARSQKNKLYHNNERLPVITCFCGFEILLVPSVKEMSEAIESHVEIHAQKIRSPSEAKAEAERIRNHLIEQALSLASEL